MPKVLIEVENLTKYYGKLQALDHLSFTVHSGDIAGILGPSGAGKTTTMRIMTGFFPPSEGRAVIAGCDVFTHAQEAKRNIGYLPESSALYPELTVTDHLEFAAGLRSLPKDRRAKRIQEVIAACGLEEERKAHIGTLSKGLRRRVGFAQAIIHAPAVLFLDEPTSGLDAGEASEIRNLIRSLADEYTIILATPILTEVAQVCERVLILHRGELINDDRTENLSLELAEAKRLYLEMEAPPGVAEETIGKIKGVVGIEPQNSKDGALRLLIYVDTQEDIRRELVKRIAQHNWLLRELRPHDLTLEEVFERLVQEEERLTLIDQLTR